MFTRQVLNNMVILFSKWNLDNYGESEENLIKDRYNEEFKKSFGCEHLICYFIDSWFNRLNKKNKSIYDYETQEVYKSRLSKLYGNLYKNDPFSVAKLNANTAMKISRNKEDFMTPNQLDNIMHNSNVIGCDLVFEVKKNTFDVNDFYKILSDYSKDSEHGKSLVTDKDNTFRILNSALKWGDTLIGIRVLSLGAKTEYFSDVSNSILLLEKSETNAPWYSTTVGIKSGKKEITARFSNEQNNYKLCVECEGEMFFENGLLFMFPLFLMTKIDFVVEDGILCFKDLDVNVSFSYRKNFISNNTNINNNPQTYNL